MGKTNILCVAWAFPPENDSGTYRLSKFIKYLDKDRFSVYVLVPERELPESRTDLKLCNEVVSAEVHRVDISGISRDPFIKTVPDGYRLGNVDALISKGIQLIEDKNIDIIFSSTPPHCMHYVAWKLSSITDTPWVMDLRDPVFHEILTPQYRRGVVSDHINAKKLYESMLVHYFCESSRVVCTTGMIADSVKEKLNKGRDRVCVIPNGYDEVESDISSSQKDRDSVFRIKYVGSLFESRRIPDSFTEAFERLVDFTEDRVVKTEFSVVGVDHAAEYHSSRFSKFNNIRFTGHISREDAMREKAGADILLLFQPDLYKECIPGKAFDYMKSGKDILVIADEDSETFRLMSEFTRVFSYSDSDGIYNYLESAYLNPNSGSAEKKYPGIERYSRKKLTKELEDVFDEVRKERIGNKELLKIYRNASELKKGGKTAEAIAEFEKIVKYRLNPSIDSTIIGGALYHIADITGTEGKRYRELLENCLEYNPEHGKATELLGSINES